MFTIKCLVTEVPDFSGDESSRALRKFNAALQALDRAKPKLTLMLVSQAVPESRRDWCFPRGVTLAKVPRLW